MIRSTEAEKTSDLNVTPCATVIYEVGQRRTKIDGLANKKILVAILN